MADALCGPSNALQRFQKHTGVDRTLQQDRLTSRRSPVESFRSFGPNAGVLDPEFEAFQSQPSSGLIEPHFANTNQQSSYRPFNSHPGAPSAGLSGWSADFQRLRISSKAPVTASQPVFQTGSDWHQDFLRQQQSQTTLYQMPQSQLHSPHMGMSPFALQRPLNTSFQVSQPGQLDLSSNQQAIRRQELSDHIDHAALEREFEAYASEISEISEVQREAEVNDGNTSTELGQDVVMDDLKEQARAMNARSLEDMRTQYRIDAANRRDLLVADPVPASSLGNLDAQHLSDVPLEQKSQNLSNVHVDGQLQPNVVEQPSINDHDQLAHTASELLDRVSDNTTKKFQDSSFLALMRQLRDREVRVEGDKMVNADVSSPSSRPAQHFHKRPSDPITCKGSSTSETILPHEQDDDKGRDAGISGVMQLSDDSEQNFA